MEKLLKIGLSILLLLCLLDMPYGYYQLIRMLGMIIFGILAINVQKTNQRWFVFWLTSAILINPFIKVSLGRLIWNFVDVIWAVSLLISLKKIK